MNDDGNMNFVANFNDLTWRIVGGRKVGYFQWMFVPLFAFFLNATGLFFQYFDRFLAAGTIGRRANVVDNFEQREFDFVNVRRTVVADDDLNG